MSDDGEVMEEEVAPWTKQDYLDLLKKDRSAGITQLSQLLFDVKHWEFERELSLDEEGIKDETHMVEDYFVDAHDIKRSQYVLKDNPDAALFELGFTVEEVEALIEAHNE